MAFLLRRVSTDPGPMVGLYSRVSTEPGSLAEFGNPGQNASFQPLQRRKSSSRLLDSFSEKVRSHVREEERRRNSTRSSISGMTAEFLQDSFGNLFDFDEEDEEVEDSPDIPDEQQDERSEAIRRLSYSTLDVVSLVSDERKFQDMKKLLRNRGCVTNSFLQQNVHLYIRHVKDQVEVE